MTYKITVIAGDGIGKEVIPATQKVLEAFNLPLEFQAAEAGYGVFQQVGTALPDETLQRCAGSDAVLFGATGSPMEDVAGYKSPILTLRKHFDLFANIRPAHGQFHDQDIDLILVRENTEGLYSRRESLSEDGSQAIAERIITRAASERIIRKACELALERRQSVTLVHKANVLKKTCGLFRTVGLAIAAEYPDLIVNELLVDTAAMKLVQAPESFDVMVTTNLFGDILSDLAAGLVGGLGLAPSANIGLNSPAVFEPVHGSAPDIAGKGIANPIATILSASMLLDYLGYKAEAHLLATIAHRTTHHTTTTATTNVIIQSIQESIINHERR